MFVPVFMDMGGPGDDGYRARDGRESETFVTDAKAVDTCGPAVDVSMATLVAADALPLAETREASEDLARGPDVEGALEREAAPTSDGSNNDARHRGIAEDPLGIRMGACLERMETSVDLFLNRILVGEVNEIVLGGFVVGAVIGLAVINFDELFPGTSIVSLVPWFVRGLWLCVLPFVLPDFIRSVGTTLGVREPMKSCAAIMSLSILAVALWMAVCDAVFLSLLTHLTGDMFE